MSSNFKTMRVPPQWADKHIAALRRGEPVEFRPRGGSMRGIVEDNELVCVVPLEIGDDPRVGDVVLVTVSGRQYLHLVWQVEMQPKMRKTRYDAAPHYLIGNNRNGVNGWVSREQIHGVLQRGS